MPFPNEQSLAFCEKPPGYVMEIKVNGRTVFDRYWSTESRARLLRAEPSTLKIRPFRGVRELESSSLNNEGGNE